MKFVQNITKLILRYPGQPPQKVSFVPIVEVLQSPQGQNKGILYYINRIELGPELLIQTEANNPAYSFAVDAAELIQSRLVSLLGQSN